MPELEEISRRFLAAARPSQAEIRSASLEAIKELANLALVRIGTVTRTGFEPWLISTDDALAKILADWEGLGTPFIPGDICWLENTVEGNRLANPIAEELMASGTWWTDVPS